MLQHRQAYISAEIGTVCGENLIVSDQNEVIDEGGDRYTALSAFDASSGCLINTLPSCKIRRNLRVIATAKHWIKYDYLCGQFVIDDRTTGQQIGRFRKNVPANMHIACTCASELLDGMVFYAYNLSNGVEENFSNISRLHAINAFIVGEESASCPLTFVTSYKGSGFADKPQGRIVSMHCHPTKQILFIVYAQGIVQVWSYAKCFLHLQMQLLKASGQGGVGDAAGEGWGDGADDRDGNDALSDDDRDGAEGGDGGDAEGSVAGSSRGRASTLGRSSTHGGVNPYASSHGGVNPYASSHGGVNPYASTHGGSLYSSSHGGNPFGGKERSRFLGGSSAKQQQMQLLQGVAYFVLPTASQLTRLDQDFASLTLLPSSFRVDSHGRFAAVVWNERLACVYDVFPLMAINLIEHTLTPINATQLNIFGAFPCRSVSNPAVCAYSFGPLCFHPSAQVLLLTVLRHKLVPNMTLPSCSRTSSSAGEHVRIPLPPLMYAISLRLHQPILSAIGSYEVGADVDVSNLGSNISSMSMEPSINWRPRALDCTLHSGLLVVTFGVSFVGGSVDALLPGVGAAVLDEAPAVEDVGSAAASASWSAEQTAQDQTDVAVILRGAQVAADSELDGRDAPAARKSAHIMLVYGLCPAWLQDMGLQFLTAPLFSQLPVPPDAYIYGEGAMNSSAVFSHRPAAEGPAVALLSGGAPSPSRPAPAVARSFALMDRPAAAPGKGSSGPGQISDQYPLLLTLRPALEDCEDENILNSLGVFYHIFRTHWVFPSFRSSATGHGSTEGSTATYMGRLPAQLKEADLEQCATQPAAWLSLPAEHRLQLTGWDAEAEAQYRDVRIAHTFYPSELVTRESAGLLSVTASTDSWGALLVGVVQRSVASPHTYHCAENSEINASTASITRRSVCFLRYEQSQGAADSASVLLTAYSSFRDAAYWARREKETTPAAVTVAGTSVQAAVSVGVVALAQSGRKLIHLSCSERNALAMVATWDLGAEMSAVWTAPAGSPDVVVLASQVSAASGDRQRLFATPPSPTALDFAAVGSAVTPANKDRMTAVLALRPQERVLQLLWQTLSSPLSPGQDRCAGLNSAIAAQLCQLQQVWLVETGTPLLALRTTQRVLICTGKLRVLNQFTYVEGPHSQAKVSGTDSLLTDFMRRLGSPSQQQAQGPFRASSSVTQDPPLGMTWVGAALCFTCESGAVQYLLPGSTCGAARDSQTHPSILSRALGFRAPVFTGSRLGNSSRGAHRGSLDSGCAGKGLFFTLPRNISTTIPGSQRLLAVLSDRVLLSYVRRDDGRYGVTSLPLVAFTQRPVNPMEPLVLGMLALEHLRPPNAAPLGQFRMDATACLLTTYMSPVQDSVSSSATGSVGAKPSAQASRRLILALSQFQQAIAIGVSDNLTDTISTLSVTEAPPTPAQTAGTLAAWCSGVRFQQAQVATAGEFPAVRWVPAGVKYAVAAQGRLYKLASLELLRSRTELQEMLLDSETYGGTALPHPQCPLATLLASAAIWFFVQTSTDASKDERAATNSATAAAFKDLCDQQKALTLRLLDIAGDYASLSAVLFKEGESVGNLVDEEVRNSNRSAYLRVASNLQRLQDAGFAKDLPAPSVAQLLQFALQGQLSVSALSGSVRHKGLTPASASAAVPDVSNTSTAQLLALEKQQKDHAARACHQQGPIPVALSAGACAAELSNAPGALPVLGPRCMGLLALDLLEDFMGVNLQLEINSVSAEDLNGGGGAGDAVLGAAGDAVDAASGIVGGMYMGRALPETWVEGVGVGSKEHELLSGYWRFSDVAYAAEDGFCCSSLRPSGTRLVFLDLSRFEGPGLELYCASKDALKVEYSTSAVDPGEKHENVKSLCDVVYAVNKEAQGELGLRCLVPRGSQLDVGMYHADPHRSKLTLELMVCFDDTKGTAASDYHVLLQRRVYCDDENSAQQTALWTLSVDRTGAVCFTFGEEGEQGAVLRSPAGSLALSQTADSPGGGWAHVALTLDSSKQPATINADSFSQSAILVTLVVKGEPTEMKMVPRTIPVDALTSTALLVGPNLCAGWRLTELRAWADLRGLTDLESQRDNYLVMAMKRKRLQLRVKGTKKLFTAYREVEVPAEAYQSVKLPSQSRGGDDDNPADAQSSTAANVASSGFSLPSKALGTKAVLGAPVALLAPKVTTTEQAADTATDAAPAPAPMSARERRLQQLKAGAGPAAGAISGPKPTSLLQRPSALAPPSPVRPAAAVESAPATTPVRASPGKALVSPSSEEAAAVLSAAKTRRVNFASFGGADASDGPVKTPVKSASDRASVAASDCFIRLGSLPELGLVPSIAGCELYSTAKPMSYPACWAECRTAVSGAALSEASSSGLQSVVLAGDRSPFTALPADLLRSAESVIVAPTTGMPSTGFRVALLANRSLLVYETTSSVGPAQLVAKMSMGAVKLAQWAFISADLVLLVSNTAGFTIRVTPPPGTAKSDSPFAPKPVKIFDRCDLRDLARWQDRWIYDLQVCADGWTLLTTGPRERQEGDSSSITVSLYHSRSAQSVSFQAAAGCFRSGLQQVLLVHQQSPDEAATERGDACWSVSAIDLSDVHAHWKSTAATTDAANKQWRESLSLHNCAVPRQWSLALPGSSSSSALPAGAQLGDWVGAACLDLASEPAQPTLRAVSASSGQVLAVPLKAFSKALSARTLPPQQPPQAANHKASYRHLVAPTAPAHVWSIGKLLYVLTCAGELHQCNIGAAEPQYIGAATLPISSSD